MMITASDPTAGLKIIPSDTINIPGPRSKYNGISTNAAANKLTDVSSLQGGFVQVLDANGNVTNQGVQVGDVVYNSSTARSAIAYVTAVDSATSLTLSADIFIAPNLDSYNIYSGNGVDLNSEEGWSMPAQRVFSGDSAATNTTAGYNPLVGSSFNLIFQSGGTYTGPATFTIQISNGTANNVSIQNDTTSASNIVGQTIEFNQASVRASGGGAAGNTGTGGFTITIEESMLEFTTPSPDQRNAKAFQVYCGGTAANPPLACDIYATTIDGDLVFFEDVQPGEILPVAICRVNVGAAAATANGNVNTLTTATARFVALT